MEARRTCLVFVLVSFVVLCGAQQSQFQLSEADPPSDLRVDSNGTVFVAAGNELFRLDSDLVEQESIELALGTSTTIQRIALSQDESRVVVCLNDESCAVYIASNFAAGAQLTRAEATANAEQVTVFTSPGDSFYAGSYGTVVGRNSIYLTQYGFGGSVFSRVVTSVYNGNQINLARRFYGGFVLGSNAYYIVYDGTPSDVRAIRVLRVCDIDQCPGGAGSCDITALYEAELVCGSSFGPETAICGVSLLSSFDGTPGNRLVVSLCESLGRNRICSFDLSMVDTAMDSVYDSCVNNPDPAVITSAVWLSEASCSSFTSASNCAGFSNPPALRTPEPGISGTLHVDLQNTVEVITSTLALTVDGSTLLYVGYTDTSLHFVGRYHITSTSTNLGLGDLTVVAETTSAVRHLQWVEGMEYIYVATEGDNNNAIEPVVFRIPLEECSTFEDCQSCAGDSNPLCGWCTVESKCSRSSECRNSSQPMRWVQETFQCVTNVADPTTFALDNPQDITVTVTPGLPPPLDGESYECYFATAGGESFFVTEAVEIMSNTQYMCDLTQVTIPPFQGASLVTDFSFRSTAIGMPFATEDDEVTVYDCPEASSCSECLQTQNACGWCIYNKQCSGTSQPCLNSNETFFLSPGDGQTFVEVCPLLEPGPFSGEYVQPVAIERNITMRTSNLQEPITGFSYGCMIGNVALGAEYVNDTTFICIVQGNQLQLPAGDNDGRDREPVRIVWRSDNGTIMHNIDTRGGAPINALLYDCNGVASSCSACLASSIGTGLECAWLIPSTSCIIDTTAAVTTDGLQCPDPAITAISPLMGPPEGGTAITINGTDLGTVFSDVDGNVMINGQPCETAGQEEGYVPGLEIVCETPNLGTTNDFTVMVTLPRENENVTVSSPVAFTTVAPSVTGVEPGFGPVAGGTQVRVMGSSLGIGNVEDTTVIVNGEECTVENPSTDVSETGIICMSSAFSGDSSQCMSLFTGDTSMCNADTPSNGTGTGTCPSFSNSVPVEVSIDAFTSQPSGVSYDYRCDPTFSRVCPADTIPAGGIQLTFFGCNLDVVQEPILIFTVGRRRQTSMGSCDVASSTAIMCMAPSLDTTPTPGSMAMVSYTIMADDAAFPDITEELQITVVANPVFSNTAVDQDYSENSGTTIKIAGTNLLNVQQSEYRVTVGGEECTVEAVTEGLLLCTPPQRTPNGQSDAPVVVLVGQNLDYSVGTLRYPKSSSSAATVVPAVIVPLIVLLAIIILLIAVYIFIHQRRSSVTLRDKDLGELQLQPVVIQNPPHHINEFMKQLPQKLIVASDQLQLLDSIGRGEFGVVYKAHLINWQGREGPQLVAAKTLKAQFGPNDESMMDEILKMQDFHHPHVMSLLGVCLDSSLRLSVIMPYMANGSLLDYLKKERKHLVLSDRENTDVVCSVQKLLLRMCYQIAQGMEYLAEQKFVHRDLAARNCMLDYLGDIKVADFGLSEDMYATGYFRQASVDATVKLPYKWMSPESLEDGLFSEKSDVWAFGVTCWEIFTGGKTPYPAVDPMSLVKLLENGQRLEKPSNAACSRKIYSVMQRCWLDESSMRPAFSDLVVSLSPLLESVAGYTQLSMTLTQPAAAEIPVEKNPVYGLMDKIAMETDLEYEVMQ